MNEKKLESRKEILDYLELEQNKLLVQMHENLKERESGTKTLEECQKLAREFELLLERNKAYRNIEKKILGIED